MNKTIKILTVGFLSLGLLTGCGTNGEDQATDALEKEQKEEPKAEQKPKLGQGEQLAMDFVKILYNSTRKAEIDKFINRYVDEDMAILYQMGKFNESDDISNLKFIDSADYEAEDGAGSGRIVKMEAKNKSKEQIQLFVYTHKEKMLLVVRSDINDNDESAFDIEEINEQYFL